MEKLFSYGTLQLESVQLDTFGRTLEGSPDNLPGYILSSIKIKDEDVIASSGLTEHPVIVFTNNAGDIIQGIVFIITPEELHQADEYEAEDYQRIQVILQSGQQAWVYVKS